MQVTLKRAAEYARALGEASAKIDIKTRGTVSQHSSEAAKVSISHDTVSGHESLATLLSTGRQKLADDHGRALAMVDAQYELRTLIGAANHSSGIAATLTERAVLDTTIKKLETFLSSVNEDRVETAEEVSRQIVRARELPKEGRYLREETITISLTSPEFVGSVKKELASRKRRRMDVQDRLGGLNLNTKVTLPPHIVSMLQQHGIIEA